MPPAPEECSRRIVKDSDKLDLKSTGDEANEEVGNHCRSDGTIDMQGSDESLSRDEIQQVSQVNSIDDSTHAIGDNNQQIDGAVQGTRLISWGYWR
jgi:hypothetical protein